MTENNDYRDNDTQKPAVNWDEVIDLIALSKVVWSKRLFVLKLTSVFFILGLVIALTSKVEYQAYCKLLPESEEGANSSIGGLSGLAGLAGIDLGLGAAGSLTPELYPEIIQSNPFQYDLMHYPIHFEKLDTVVTSYTYFSEIDRPSFLMIINEYTIGLPGKIKQLFSSSEENEPPNYRDGLLRFSKKDTELLEKYKDRVSVMVEKKTGVITVYAEMPDAYAAAQLTDYLVKKLTEEVADYKSDKAKRNLEFVQQRYAEAEKEYGLKQRSVASFTDKNKNITSSMVQIEFQRLQNEMNIAFEVFKGLANQLEQAKINVKSETPVFTVLEPVKVPVDKAKPNRKLIVLLSIILGLFVGIGITLLREKIFVKLYDNE